MVLNLCVPTLKRYDLLRLMLESAEVGDLKPTAYYIIDNGGELNLSFPRTIIKRPGYNMGVAGSWNWFLQNVPGINLICNDDLSFSASAISKMYESYDPRAMVTPQIMMHNAFSCYILGDEVVKYVGYFDEKISPRYAYFEDNDYYRRMTLSGFQIISAPGAIVSHAGSATLISYTHLQRDIHNKKFEIAQKNYVTKWGGTPGHERRTVPREL